MKSIEEIIKEQGIQISDPDEIEELIEEDEDI